MSDTLLRLVVHISFTSSSYCVTSSYPSSNVVGRFSSLSSTVIIEDDSETVINEYYDASAGGITTYTYIIVVIEQDLQCFLACKTIF